MSISACGRFQVSQAFIYALYWFISRETFKCARVYTSHIKHVQQLEVDKRGGGYCRLRYCCLESLDREMLV